MIIPIVGDSTSYERALKRSETATKQFGAAIGTTSPRVGKFSQTAQLAGSSTLFFAGAATGLATAIGGRAISDASDLNEQLDRTRVVMGKAADAMIAWSETTASSIGISQRSALTAAATFAGLFKTVGVGQTSAGEMSRVLVKLAADLASLQDASPEEALTALRSGLAGEAEPLRRFNIFLSEARVQQAALAETGKKATSALTQQEKTVARYNLILRDGAIANDNFKNTSGSLANQQRTLNAEMEDLSSNVGQVLVPSMQAAAAIAVVLVRGVNDLTGAVGALHRLIREAEIWDPWNRGVEEANKETVDFLERLRDGIPGMEKFLELRDRMIHLKGEPPPEVLPTRRGHGAGGRPAQTPTEAAAASARAAQDAIARATRQANASLSQQISDSQRRAQHLRDLIRQDPSNVTLQQRLTAELKKGNGLRAQQVQLNQQAASAARSETEAVARTNRERREARREREREAAEARRSALKAGQFRALGLTAEGLQPTPGSGSLLKRALGLQERVKGTALDTDKTRQQLRRIVNLLRKDFKTAGKDVRQAILGMLNDISGAFDEGAAKSGPLTKSHGLRTAQIIKNLGLSVEQAEEIQRRLAHATTGSRPIASAAGRGVATLPRQGFGPMPVVVEAHTTINLDGHKVANVVTRSQQKTRRRNPKQKRGPNR